MNIDGAGKITVNFKVTKLHTASCKQGYAGRLDGKSVQRASRAGRHPFPRLQGMWKVRVIMLPSVFSRVLDEYVRNQFAQLQRLSQDADMCDEINGMIESLSAFADELTVKSSVGHA